MAKKEKNVEVEVKGASLAYPSMPQHKPVVSIEEIKNGYVVRACCGDNDPEFVENLAKAPAILKKLFNIGNKSYGQIQEMTKGKRE